MPKVLILDHDAVLAAVTPAAAIERTREAFLAHHRGEWVMPSKVYLDSPPFGDFRAMPARGGELAMLKWISSFPGNPAGPADALGVVRLGRAHVEPLALLDARSVTALRTGAVAAVATRALAPPGRDGRHRRLRPARRMGGALPGRRGPRGRRLRRPRAEAAEALAPSSAWLARGVADRGARVRRRAA